MSEEPYVNRRGRPLMKEDLADLRIDDEKIETATQPAPLSKRKSPRQPMNKRRRRLIFGAIVAVILLPIAAGETIRFMYQQSSQSTVTQARDLAKHTVVPLQQKTDVTAKDISAVVSTLNQLRDKACPGGLVDNIAKLYPRASAALNDCLLAKGKIAALALATKDFSEQLKYLEDISPLLSAVTPKNDEPYAIAASQADNWKTLSDNIKNISPPTSFRETHAALLTHTTAIATQWTALNNASSAQDTTAFNDVAKKLGEEYSAIRALTTDFSTTIAATQKRASEASAI